VNLGSPFLSRRPARRRATDVPRRRSGRSRGRLSEVKSPRLRAFLWSGRWDSNPRHLAWEASALPTELRPRSLHPSRVRHFRPSAHARIPIRHGPTRHSGSNAARCRALPRETSPARRFAPRRRTRRRTFATSVASHVSQTVATGPENGRAPRRGEILARNHPEAFKRRVSRPVLADDASSRSLPRPSRLTS
jgi:hypothetical protein